MCGVFQMHSYWMKNRNNEVYLIMIVDNIKYSEVFITK